MHRITLWLAGVALLALANAAAFVWLDTPSRTQADVDARSAAAAPAPLRPAATAPATGPAPQAGRSAPEALPAEAGKPGLLMPVQGIDIAQVHDTFDQPRGSERRHEAMDVMAPAGTPVLAVADGRIEKLFTSDRGGLTIYQFDPTGTWSYYYAHLQAYAPGLAEGMDVRRGDVLGTVGSSGNADPAAPHLHFAVFRLTPERQWWTGEPVNPWPLLERAAAAPPRSSAAE